MGVQATVVKFRKKTPPIGEVVAKEDEIEGLSIRFTYVLRYGDWRLIRMELGPPDGVSEQQARSLTPSEIRHLPLARLHRAAHATLTAHGRRMAGVRRHYDEGNAALLHLVEIAGAYRANLAAGLKDPAGAIAKAYDVKPSTARSWVYRARKEGLLGPATSRTAGELLREVSDGDQA